MTGLCLSSPCEAGEVPKGRRGHFVAGIAKTLRNGSMQRFACVEAVQRLCFACLRPTSHASLFGLDRPKQARIISKKARTGSAQH